MRMKGGSFKFKFYNQLCVSLVILFCNLKVDFVFYSEEQEGIKTDPIELSQFIDFIKHNKLQTGSFIIGENECKLTASYIISLVLCSYVENKSPSSILKVSLVALTVKVAFGACIIRKPQIIYPWLFTCLDLAYVVLIFHILWGKIFAVKEGKDVFMGYGFL